MPLKPPVFFDIETGGLTPRGERASSILSISYGRTGEVAETFAHPEAGTFVSSFSEKEIMPQVRSATQTFTEQQNLLKFIEHLEANPQAPVVGYNIQGFDLPFMQERARRHGMAGRLNMALQGRRQIDVGIRTKLLVARQITEHIEKGTFREALGGARTFAEASVQMHRGRLTAEQKQAYNMLSQMRAYDIGQHTTRDAYKQVRGWKLGQIFGLLEPESTLGQKAHQASADIMMTEKIHKALLSGELEEVFQRPDTAKAWLASSLQLQQEAKAFNKNAGYIYTPKGWDRVKAVASRVPQPIRRLAAGGAMLFGALAGMAAVKSAFSGRDDDWNSISGLSETGTAGQLRKNNTDFGSGWKGGVIDVSYLEGALQDEIFEEMEFRRLVRSIRKARDDDSVLQLINENRAKKVFEETLQWPEGEDPGQIDRFLMEREGLGYFGWYQPGSNTLSVGGYLDPNDALAWLAGAHGNQSIAGGLVSTVAGYISPTKVEDTIVHEGLHSMWDEVLSQDERDVFIGQATKQFQAYREAYEASVETGEFDAGAAFQHGSDVIQLAEKAPAYYANVVKAYSYLAAGDEDAAEPYVEWVANEMFAHRGAALISNNDTMYKFERNETLDKIAQTYVLNKPKRKNYIAQYRGRDPGLVLSEEGFTPQFFIDNPPSEAGFMGGGDIATQFSGMEEGGFAARWRHAHTPFGSPADLGKAVAQASKLYKSRLGAAAGQKLTWTEDAMEVAGMGHVLSMSAVTETGEEAFELLRSFTKEGVELTSVEIHKSMRGKGIGKRFYEEEVDILKEIGYQAGETITSPVVSPITARWQMQQYGSKIMSSPGLTEFTGLEQRVMAKQIALGDMPAVIMKGKIPSKPPSFTQEVQKMRTEKAGRSVKRVIHQQKTQSERTPAQFSGRDDQWNTQEGLHEGGWASRLRKLFGFGSGWRGIIKMPSVLAKHGGREFYGAATSIKGAESYYARYIRDAQKAAKTMKEAGMEMPLKIPKEVREFKKAIDQAKTAGFDNVMMINTEAIKQAAKTHGVSAGSLIKHTIAHERIHLSRGLMRGDKYLYADTPQRFLQHMKGANYNAGRMNTWTEEYLANVAAVTRYPDRTVFDRRVASVMLHSSTEQIAKAIERVKRVERIGHWERTKRMKAYHEIRKIQVKKVVRAEEQQRATQQMFRDTRAGRNSKM